MKDYFIDEKISQLTKKHRTRDPFKIAERKRIIVVFEPLGEVLGYYNRLHRIQFIHLNNCLDEHQINYTCCHELGHCILHPNENTPQLSAASLVSELKVEKEAEYFATNLIIDGSHKELYRPTKYEILDYYGLPWYLDRYMG